MDAQHIESETAIRQRVRFQNSDRRVAFEADVEHGEIHTRSHWENVIGVVLVLLGLSEQAILGVSIHEFAKEGHKLRLVDKTLSSHVFGRGFLASSYLLDFCQMAEDDRLIVLCFVFVDGLQSDGAFLANQLLTNAAGRLSVMALRVSRTPSPEIAVAKW